MPRGCAAGNRLRFQLGFSVGARIDDCGTFQPSDLDAPLRASQT